MSNSVALLFLSVDEELCKNSKNIYLMYYNPSKEIEDDSV